MQGSAKQPRQVDPLTGVLRLLRQAGIIILAVVLVKLLFIDIAAVQTDQMSPAIRKGDRVLTLRLPYLPLVRSFLGPSRHQPVIFSFPGSNRRGCLRVAGISGDTILVDSGSVRNDQNRKLRQPVKDSAFRSELVPREYSPRDFMPRVALPNPGSRLALDSLDHASFFMLASIIRQENPGSVCSLAVLLDINGTPAVDYYLPDFSLYKGPLAAVPDSLRFDWFFWYRLKEYLHQSRPDRVVRLRFALYRNGERITAYTVKKRFVFLIADQWKTGYDSRYFGPMASVRVRSRPLVVLYAITPGKGFNIQRMGRFIQ